MSALCWHVVHGCRGCADDGACRHELLRQRGEACDCEPYRGRARRPVLDYPTCEQCGGAHVDEAEHAECEEAVGHILARRESTLTAMLRGVTGATRQRILDRIHAVRGGR